MNGLSKGGLLAGVHLALVLSLGAKLLVDRATRPRLWVKTVPVDPSLPIRGRYVSLQVEVPVTGVDLPALRPRPSHLKDADPWPPVWETHNVQVDLVPSSAGLTACKAPPSGKGDEAYAGNAILPEGNRALPKDQWVVRLREPLACFIPEHVPDPSRRGPGEELWVEVTLPKKGPLRPIRLGVKKNGVLTPLTF
ncbi:MAG: hypothetical protein HY014_07095 [Acidobacteria bacterium]|nr:hypothetical protein [Acidobacteriota bacterium]MBI3487918.1 hypothetical protein [Acidobacteriota bacterium]